MKKLILILFSVISLGFFSCSDSFNYDEIQDVQNENNESKNEVTIENSRCLFSGSGGSKKHLGFSRRR